MMRYTEYHAGVAVIKDKSNMKEAMQRFAELEELATPKKPTEHPDNGEIRHIKAYICPNCGKGFTGKGIAKFCYHCGQRLDWSE